MDTIHDLTNQHMRLVVGVDGGLALEAMLRAIVQVTVSLCTSREEFDDVVEQWPAGARTLADECWRAIRLQVDRPANDPGLQ